MYPRYESEEDFGEILCRVLRDDESAGHGNRFFDQTVPMRLRIVNGRERMTGTYRRTSVAAD